MKVTPQKKTDSLQETEYVLKDLVIMSQLKDLEKVEKRSFSFKEQE